MTQFSEEDCLQFSQNSDEFQHDDGELLSTKLNLVKVEKDRRWLCFT